MAIKKKCNRSTDTVLDIPKKSRYFDSSVFDFLIKIELNSFWFLSRNKLILGLIKKYHPFLKCFLEVGCGTGYVIKGIADQYPQASYSAVEVYEEAIPYILGRMGKRISLYQVDAMDMNFYQEFDLVGSFDVLEHIEDDISVIRNIYRAMRSGGTAIIAVPQHPFLWSDKDELACHKRRYKRGELEYKLKQSGFEIVYSTSYFMTLMPFMLLSRLMKIKPDNEHRPGFLTDKLFRVLLAVERLLITCRINLPFGGSRFVVARKPVS